MEYEEKFFGAFTGRVVENEDPHGLRRVRVFVPGVCEPMSAWAKPFGAAKHHTPRVGEEVVVFFEQGVLEYPRFEVGGYTQDVGLPQESEDGKPFISVFETENFRMVVDERDGHRALRLFSRKAEDLGVVGGGDMLEFNFETNTVTLCGTTTLNLKALGEVVIDAPVVTIAGRIVMPTEDQI